MGFDESAAQMANQVRSRGRGFLTMRREELREQFGVGRWTPGQAAAACEALARQGIYVYPNPNEASGSVRLYDQKHPLGRIAEAVARPTEIPDSALNEAAQIFERERAGRDLRSDDLPWIQAFDLLLQVAIGREPEDWEDLRDDRPGAELARTLGEALGLRATVLGSPSFTHIASAVTAIRPRGRRWLAADLAHPDDGDAVAFPLLDAISATNRRLADEHTRLLELAARWALGKEQIPSNNVELGVLHLRYRRENARNGT
jgi:hypothetical protein